MMPKNQEETKLLSGAVVEIRQKAFSHSEDSEPLKMSDDRSNLVHLVKNLSLAEESAAKQDVCVNDILNKKDVSAKHIVDDKSQEVLKRDFQSLKSLEEEGELVERGPVSSRTRTRTQPYIHVSDSPSSSSESSQDSPVGPNGERYLLYGGSLFVNSGGSLAALDQKIYPTATVDNNNRRKYVHQNGGNFQLCSDHGLQNVLLGSKNEKKPEQFVTVTPACIPITTSWDSSIDALCSPHRPPTNGSLSSYSSQIESSPFGSPVAGTSLDRPSRSSSGISTDTDSQTSDLSSDLLSPPDLLGAEAMCFDLQQFSLKSSEQLINCGPDSTVNTNNHTVPSSDPLDNFQFSTGSFEAIEKNPIPDFLADFINNHTDDGAKMNINKHQYQKTLADINRKIYLDESNCDAVTSEITDLTSRNFYNHAAEVSHLNNQSLDKETLEKTSIQQTTISDGPKSEAVLLNQQSQLPINSACSISDDFDMQNETSSMANGLNGNYSSNAVIYIQNFSSNMNMSSPTVFILSNSTKQKKERPLAPKPVSLKTELGLSLSESKTVYKSTSVDLNLSSNEINLRATILKEFKEEIRRKMHCFFTQMPNEVITMPDADGDTRLHITLTNGEALSSVILIDRYAELSRLDVANKRGETPLLCAVSGGKEELLRYLLAKGADVNARIRKDGGTILHYVAERGHSLITFLEILCLQPNVNLNSYNNLGQTPLMCAVTGHGKELHIDKLQRRETVNAVPAIRLLMKCNASVMCRDRRSGKTVYHLAVEKKNHLLLQVLCENSNVQEAVNETTFDGNTPLHYAAVLAKCNIEEQLRIIDLLMRYGASAHEANIEHKLPSDLVDKSKKEIKKMLLSARHNRVA